jgi:AcrR family transcriptional regulator
MVVRAALPLVAEHGAAVTTLQVARAAGIGEATIFRVFPDKGALLDACVAEALDPEHVLLELRSISLDQPLAARLIEAADALHAHLARMGALIGALHASGHRRPRTTEGDPPPEPSVSRDAAQAATREAVAELFEPDQASLRRPAVGLAEVFLGMLFVRSRTLYGNQPQLDTADLVDVLLHGALTADTNSPGGHP